MTENGTIWSTYEATLRELDPACLPEHVTLGQDRTAVQQARELGISQEVENRAVSRLLQVPILNTLLDMQPWPEFVQITPISYCRQNTVVAMLAADDTRIIAFSNIDSWQHADIVGRWLKTPVKAVLCSQPEIEAAINRSYEEKTDTTSSLLNELVDDPGMSVAELVKRDDLLDSGDRAPVIQLVNSILFEAVRSKSSDVHIQPREHEVAVRMRIDGVLFDIHKLPKQIQEEVVTRMKVLGKMNIAEKRLPQDGRASVKVGQRAIDLRIASMPTSHGERVVIRLLDKSAKMYTLEELGMDEFSLQRFRSVIHQEHGLILVTGPTGSGKSTTLYSSLQELNTDERNAVTLEDPIEYELDGISQTQINVRKGMTFASGLRSVLRQDPDIIMLGEIRDHETAVMAIQSSLTGHMVFSTLHTNDAPSAVTRLLDLGIEPYLASSSLLAVLAQRLVRRICPNCRSAINISDQQRSATGLNSDISEVFHGTGCGKCRNTGYQGRFGIFELLMVTEAIQHGIQKHANAAEIRALGLQQGMRAMRLDGIQKVLDGKTTIDEVLRVSVETL
jgi:general secretion pathway protein E